MNWKEIVVDYLTFTRKERVGIITLLLLIAIAIFLPAAFSKYQGNSQPATDTTWIAAVKKLEKTEFDETHNNNENDVSAYQYDPSKNYNTNNTYKGELFYFDPNTISKEEWGKLGIRDKTIQTIQNYLNKGGYFRKAEDLQRVYGLHKDEYERLAPYVKIEAIVEVNEKPVLTENRNASADKTTYSKKSQYSIIDINSADTTGFINLPGIGSKLAARIINFRNKLGGFYTIEQVKETFGLPDSTFQKIKPLLVVGNIAVKKINVNTATVDELKGHPYVRYTIANAIVVYRNQHGSFVNMEDLKKIMLITGEVYQKIIPYLSL